MSEDFLSVAHAMAEAARPAALARFRAVDLTAENKAGPGGYDPVTEADRAAEDAMREVLAARRPGDAVIGEERGRSAGETGYEWVLDPIDGTRAYIVGAPTWGVLIGLRRRAGEALSGVLGMMDQPWTCDRFWGDGKTAWAARPGIDPAGAAPRPLRTRGVEDLAAARICTTFPEVGSAEERDAFHRLAGRTQLTRYGLDCTAYALLAAGQVDLVVEAGLNAYDVMPLVPIIEGAGGIVTTWDGGPALEGGRVIAAANPALHAAALEVLRID